MFNPLVSIIIPVYNGSNYMKEAIDSALSQTYKNIEVIVVNDGSKDDGATENIALSYGDKIRYFSKENGGVSSALNMGINNMRGDYFSWLSHDDVYEADKVEKQVLALQNVPRNTVICCNYIHIDENSKKINLPKPMPFLKAGSLYDSGEVLKSLLQKSTLNGCCLLIPKSAFAECGYFDENLRFCQDAFMWYNIFIKGYSLFCTDNISVKNRVHSNQFTQTGQALFRKECAMVSDYLAREFARISNKKNNYLKMYLLSDAKYLEFKDVKKVISAGKDKKLISGITKIRCVFIYLYGRIRPFIRKVYYKIFRNIKTS